VNCVDVQRALFEAGDERDGHPSRDAIIEHVEGCPTCAIIANTQRRVDELLVASLPPPIVSSSCRARLYQQLDAPLSTFTVDALPDLLHLASCAALTGYCAIVAPAQASAIVSIGTVVTAATYVLFALLRNTLDEASL
jgi:hypothetical protein